MASISSELNETTEIIRRTIWNFFRLEYKHVHDITIQKAMYKAEIYNMGKRLLTFKLFFILPTIYFVDYEVFEDERPLSTAAASPVSSRLSRIKSGMGGCFTVLCRLTDSCRMH